MAVTIESGLDSPLWSWTTSYTDNENNKKSKTISGVNIIAPNISAETAATGTEEYEADPATGYTPFRAKVLSQALANFLNVYYAATTLAGKFDATTAEP